MLNITLNSLIELISNKNVLTYIILYIISFYLYKNKSLKINSKNKNLRNLIQGIPILYFIVTEILNYFFGIDFTNCNDRTKFFYNLPDFFINNSSENSTNLSDGIFPQNRSYLDPITAEHNKFKKYMELMNIKPNSKIKILDIGCGTGSSLDFWKSQGIDSTGITFSIRQYNIIKSKGLKVIKDDFTKLIPELVGQFDIITNTGNTEHGFCGNPRLLETFKKKKQKIHEYIKLWSKYFNPKSNFKYLLINTLYINPIVMNDLSSYIMERTYGGCYPLDKKDFRIIDNLQDYDILKTYDNTIGYYLATIHDKNHFGHPGIISVYMYVLALFLVPIYPLLIYLIAYDMFGLWMWQFDRKYHMFYNKFKDYTFEEDRKKRPTTLLWHIMKYKK